MATATESTPNTSTSTSGAPASRLAPTGAGASSASGGAKAAAASATKTANGAKRGPQKGVKRGPRTGPTLTWTEPRLAALVSLAVEHDGFFVRVMNGLITHPAFSGDADAIARLKSEDGPQIVRNRYKKLRAIALEDGYSEDQVPELSSGRGRKVNLEKILGPKQAPASTDASEDDEDEDEDTEE